MIVPSHTPTRLNGLLSRLPAATAAIFALACACRADLDTGSFDPSVKPQADFYGYVNGIWLKTTAIPAYRNCWSAFDEAHAATENNLRLVCERASAVGDQGTSIEKIVGDFYASGLDDAAIAEAGSDPIRFELDRIDALRTPADVTAEIAHLHELGVDIGFRFTSVRDPAGGPLMMAALAPAALSLPETADYSRKDRRDAFTAHIMRLLALVGIGDEEGGRDAAAVLKVETALAGIGPSAAESLPVEELPQRAPGFDWTAYFTKSSAPPFATVAVEQPAWCTGFAAVFASTSVAEWRGYLLWRFLHAYAHYLSPPFADEEFSFYGQTLEGLREPPPHWQRVVDTIDASVGDALSQLYLSSFYSPDATAQVQQLAERIHQRMPAHGELTVKVGGPDRWRSYDGLVIDRGAYVLNVLKARAWLTRNRVAQIGHPAEANPWPESALSGEVVYDAARRTLFIPAALVQPPLFDPAADDAVNFGALGAEIGRALARGDSRGRSDARVTAALNRQFQAFLTRSRWTANNPRLLTDNAADLSGVELAYAALEAQLDSAAPEKIGGFTERQRFFLSYATLQRAKYRPGTLEQLWDRGKDVPGEFHVNGLLPNIDGFEQAFAIAQGAPLWLPPAARVGDLALRGW